MESAATVSVAVPSRRTRRNVEFVEEFFADENAGSGSRDRQIGGSRSTRSTCEVSLVVIGHIEYPDF